VKVEEKQKEQKKYTVKPPKDLRSKYELKMDQRVVDAERDEKARMKREDEQRQAVSQGSDASINFILCSFFIAFFPVRQHWIWKSIMS
jgi:hypothetical protein